MAHECPECWQVCYCGKDIDDMLMNRDEDVNRCTHCSEATDNDDYNPDMEDEPE